MHSLNCDNCYYKLTLLEDLLDNQPNTCTRLSPLFKSFFGCSDPHLISILTPFNLFFFPASAEWFKS